MHQHLKRLTVLQAAPLHSADVVLMPSTFTRKRNQERKEVKTREEALHSAPAVAGFTTARLML